MYNRKLPRSRKKMGCGSSQIEPANSADQRPVEKPDKNGAINNGNNKRVSSTDSNANRSDRVTSNPGKLFIIIIYKIK